MRWPLALMALAVISLSPLCANAEDKVVTDVIEEDSAYFDSFWGIPEGRSINITITANDEIDVYILPFSEVADYLNGDPFKPEYQILKTTNAKFTWKVPSTDGYELYIDNRYNQAYGSANPDGPVGFTYTRGEPFMVPIPAGSPASAFDPACFIVGIVGILLVVLAVFMMWRRKRASHRARREESVQAGEAYEVEAEDPDAGAKGR